MKGPYVPIKYVSPTAMKGPATDPILPDNSFKDITLAILSGGYVISNIDWAKIIEIK